MIMCYVEVHWSEVLIEMISGKKKQLEIQVRHNLFVEFECEFVGSVDTLINI